MTCPFSGFSLGYYPDDEPISWPRRILEATPLGLLGIGYDVLKGRLTPITLGESRACSWFTTAGLITHLIVNEVIAKRWVVTISACFVYGAITGIRVYMFKNSPLEEQQRYNDPIFKGKGNLIV